jgi:triosephosphate isomerase
VGESKKMDNNRAWKEIKKHIDSIVPSLRRSKKYILAYEPVWAIGGGARVDGAYVQEMIYRIKLYMRAQTNSIPRVLYGGSVDGKFVESLLHYQSSIDGFLVGSASVRKKDIITIIKKIYGTT